MIDRNIHRVSLSTLVLPGIAQSRRDRTTRAEVVNGLEIAAEGLIG